MMQVVLVVLRGGEELLVCWRFLVADPWSDLLGCVQCAAAGHILLVVHCACSVYHASGGSVWRRSGQNI